jgi:chitodextrinase
MWKGVGAKDLRLSVQGRSLRMPQPSNSDRPTGARPTWRLYGVICACLLISFISSTAQAQTSPLGYWNFDEDTGTVAHDSSGNGYNGTVSNAIWTTGKINYALLFNGASSAVVTPNIPLANTFSVSAWVNPSTTPQGGYARIAETSYNGGLYLGTNSSGTKYKFIVNTGQGSTRTCGAGYGCAEGGTIAAGWHLVTATFDGTTATLYVDATVVATDTFTPLANTKYPLYIGRYSGGNSNGWYGKLDEVRLYNRVLASTEVSAMYTDMTPPTVPANVAATAVSSTQINVTWSASTDDVSVAGYQVYRNGAQVGTTTSLSYSDKGLTASTTYSYTVAAYDVAGNASPQSKAASATTLAADTILPTVSITAPAANTTMSGMVTVTARASDNVAVADVQFQLDGSNLGPDLTTAPYTISWNTTTVSNGSHTLTAIARDTSGNKATSAGVVVTVSNTVTAPPTSGLLGYWNFDENGGTVAHDSTGNGYNGTVNGATWTTGKINTALGFNGTSNYVLTGNILFATAFSISTWVNPAAAPQGAYIRIAETQYNLGFYLGVNSTGSRYKFIVNGGTGATGNCGAGYGCAEGGTISSGWHLITGTYDGATARLYVDQNQIATETFKAPANASLPLYIGQYYGGSGYGWNGVIDEVRLYNRALTSTEVSAIYNYTGVSDPLPPTVPGNVTATAVSRNQINVAWHASTDDVSVAGYQVYRNGTLVGTTTGLSYSDTGLTASTTYSYTVAAYDAGGNVSAQSAPVSATTLSLTISKISVDVLTPSGATITWTTNEPANSQVVYGLTTTYGSGPIMSSKFTTAHAIALSGLASSTTYHFRVQSTDAAGNIAVSADNVFTTTPTPSWPVGWTQLPNTLMQNVCPPNYFNGQNYAFYTECYRLLIWGGAFADTRRNRLLIWGGGHDNYYGNELYSLNLNNNPATLTRLNNPSPIVTPGSPTCPTTLSDGNPNARETQNNLAYIANLDLMFSFNGGLACGNGYHYNDTWILNPASLQWTPKDPVKGPITSTSSGPYYANSGYSPSTQTVFTQWADTLFQYSFASNTYSQLSVVGYAHFPYASTGAIDPKRQLFIAMGTEYQSTAPHIYVIDLSGAGSYASLEWTSQVTGCAGLAGSNWPGLVYDYALDRIVGYPNQGNTVYVFNPDTKTCTTQTYANGPQNTPDAVTQGTFGRFQYFPAMDAFAVVNAVDDNAYILRLTAQ